MMNPIHIVDRLTATHKAISNGLEEVNRNSIIDLLREARDRIHELEGLAYSYPPIHPHLPSGTTWRQEHEDLHDSLIKMTCEEFSEWQEATKD